MIDATQGQICAVVLGIMQDGGLPHIGCRCSRCLGAYHDSRRAEFSACLAVIDRRGGKDRVWLIDATPDIKHQVNLVGDFLGAHASQPNRLRQPDGIFLTHADMGHIAGLSQFGPAAMVVNKLKLYGSAGVIELIQNTDLWQNAEDFEFLPLADYSIVDLGEHLSITPIAVPHSDDWGIGTFAYRITGPNKSLLYLPDIDNWKLWPQAGEILSAVDYALVDATFFSTAELGGRPSVAHPLVPETLEFCADSSAELTLIHINHTNPVLDPASLEHKRVVDAGAKLAKTGELYVL